MGLTPKYSTIVLLYSTKKDAIVILYSTKKVLYIAYCELGVFFISHCSHAFTGCQHPKDLIQS